MTDRERLAKRLRVCHELCLEEVEQRRWLEYGGRDGWQGAAEDDAWLALADLIGPALELPEAKHLSWGARQVLAVNMKFADWQAHVDAVKRVWGETITETEEV